MAFRIRPAQQSDLARLLELQAASTEAAQWSAAQCRSAIAGEAALRCIVAEWNGDAAGMIVFRGPVAGESEILNLAVAPENRRQGIGRALVRVAGERSAEVYLEVRRSNLGGQAFYRRCGFEGTGCRKDYYRDPQEDAIVMKWGSAVTKCGSTATKCSSGGADGGP
ncbi:MAG: ribosomal protein S18-alanine N-acetyltransferase [Bryobacterales bacterium]